MTEYTQGFALRLSAHITVNPAAVPSGRPYIAESSFGTTAADALAGTATVVDSITVGWSRPGGRDHLEPYTWTCSLIGSHDDLSLKVFYDAEVTVRMAALGGGELARGWVRDITRTRREADGLWVWRLTLDGPTSRAQAARVGAQPWPLEAAATRVSRLGIMFPKLLQVQSTQTETIAGARVAARDVDSAPLLDVWQRTVAAQGAFASENIDNRTGHLTVISQVPNVGVLARSGTPAHISLPVPTTLYDLPANCVEDVARVTGRDTLVTAGDAITRDDTGNDVITSVVASNSSGLPASAWRWETDAPTADAATLAAWVQNVIDARSTPAWNYTEGQRLALATLPLNTGLRLLYPSTRHTVSVRVSGNAPADMPTVLTVTAATFVLRADQIDSLTVTLVDAATAGLRAARFTDFAANQPWMTTKTPAATWAEFGSSVKFTTLANLTF